MRTTNLLSGTLVGLFLFLAPPTALANSGRSITEGRLDASDTKGKPLGICPLKHTDVTVDISGFIARVTVRQQFHNPFKDKIEAIYVFPLSQDAAVDKMTMKVGERFIKGEIKEREEARKIYEQAKAQGRVASLLNQERPNIFTQSVANIEPGEQVDITISYSETLEWKDAEYSFDFPMVVGPRYIPGGGSAPAPLTKGRPTPQVPDADRITPPVTPEGTRAGHDISVTVNLNAGLPLQRIDSKQHEIMVDYTKDDKSQATIKLRQAKTIPNKDFVLVYETASNKIEDTILTHTDKRGKFFTLVLQPPKRVRKQLIVPKEIVFVIDKSGSMRGFPINTAKEAMRLCIEGLHENDTFNLMTFAGGVGFCFDNPVPNTDENREKALGYLGDLEGSGGTEMMKAIHACLARQDDPERVRVVCFMTDGYVGNDMGIIDAVKKNAGVARVFSFGIGSSVNRYLLDGIAKAGRGEVHYILNEKQANGAGERFFERVRTPVLTDIELDFGKLTVSELYPKAIPDLFSSTPVVVNGQYKEGGKGTITLRGKTGAGKFERTIDVTLPDALPDAWPDEEVLASHWARAKVDHLMGKDMGAIQDGRPDPALKEEILGLGLRFQLLTRFTSFVAVEEMKVTAGGVPRTVEVPVEMPHGVSYQGVFGKGRLLSDLGGVASSGLGSRIAGGRAGAVRRSGGNAGSESAVETALHWLAAHQNHDGSWSFVHTPGDKCSGFPNPGEKNTKMGATGLALLPFLGAGYTHQDGKYQEVVKNGLKYLFVPLVGAGTARLLGLGGPAHPRWPSWVAVVAGLLGVALLVYLDRSNTLLQYEVWIDRGNDHPVASFPPQGSDREDRDEKLNHELHVPPFDVVAQERDFDLGLKTSWELKDRKSGRRVQTLSVHVGDAWEWQDDNGDGFADLRVWDGLSEPTRKPSWYSVYFYSPEKGVLEWGCRTEKGFRFLDQEKFDLLRKQVRELRLGMNRREIAKVVVEGVEVEYRPFLDALPKKYELFRLAVPQGDADDANHSYNLLLSFQIQSGEQTLQLHKSRLEL